MISAYYYCLFLATLFYVSPLEVIGFSVGGRVVDSNGNGVDGAKIVVDGRERSITDEEGYYKLDQLVTSYRYSIEAKKEHHKFERLNDFLILPNMASIVDIKVISYDICGVVHITNSSDHKAKVALTHGPENVKLEVKHTDKSGNFCFEVPPGEYRISASAATNESASLFSPAYIDVVVNKPLLSITFNQAQANIRGLVGCQGSCRDRTHKEICCVSSVSVMLIRLDGRIKDEKRIINFTGDYSSEFLFSNVMPGKYRVEVKRSFPEDIWCWEQSFVDVDVGSEDVEGIAFNPKGYVVKIISDLEADAYLELGPLYSITRVDVKIKKGYQHICVPYSFSNFLKFVDPCDFSSLGYHINGQPNPENPFPSPIHLKPRHVIEGRINFELNYTLPYGILLPLDILGSDGTIKDVIYLDDFLTRKVDDPFATYAYLFQANIGENYTIIPRDLSNGGGKKLLFYPRQQHVSMGKRGCQGLVPPFYARLGLYIEGSVSPPLSDVHIRVLAENYSQNSLLKQGDLAFETTTGKDGLFRAGPLYDDIDYSIKASKPGYHLKQVGPNSFNYEKLATLSLM